MVLFWPVTEKVVPLDFKKKYKKTNIPRWFDSRFLTDIYPPSMATAKNCFNKFQHGRTLVFDESYPGASKMATSEDDVTKVNDHVLVDRWLKMQDDCLRAATEISAELCRPLENVFFRRVKKLKNRWVEWIELGGDYVQKKIAIFPNFSFSFVCLIIIEPSRYICAYICIIFQN